MNVKNIILSILVLITIGTNLVYSCQPIIPRHPFRDAKAVFLGELIEIIKTNDRCENVAKFKVERYWKGKIEEFVNVQTSTTLCCGYNFRVGEKYLVYAYSEKSLRLETSAGWVLLDDFTEERIKKLGRGKMLESKNVESQ